VYHACVFRQGKVPDGRTKSAVEKAGSFKVVGEICQQKKLLVSEKQRVGYASAEKEEKEKKRHMYIQFARNRFSPSW